MTLAEQIKMILEIERQQLPISGSTHGIAVSIIRQLTAIMKVQHCRLIQARDFVPEGEVIFIDQALALSTTMVKEIV